MASKIRELESVLGAGARNNKYKVMFPYFGREIDIQVHNVSAPGRSIGVAEVFLKGRKYQLAGDRSDEGTFTLTFYNDPELILRRFFLQIISGVQSFQVPKTINDYNFDSKITLGNLAVTAFREIKNNITNFSNAFGNTTLAHNNLPWYQSDIKIQQLDHLDEVTTESIYHSAFITDVSGIDYQDETGDVSTTTITLAYTGASYGTDNLEANKSW